VAAKSVQWRGSKLARRFGGRHVNLRRGCQFDGRLQSKFVGSLGRNLAISLGLLFEGFLDLGILLMSRQALELERVLNILCNHFHDQTPFTTLATAIFIMRPVNVSRRAFFFGAFARPFTVPAESFPSFCRIANGHKENANKT
jgi:hypothetical protein